MLAFVCCCSRFVLSLADCPDCLVTDDHLSILPMSPFAFLAPSLPTKQDVRIDSVLIFIENECLFLFSIGSFLC